MRVQAPCPRLYSLMCMTGSCGDLDGPTVHLHSAACSILITKFKMAPLQPRMQLSERDDTLM